MSYGMNSSPSTGSNFGQTATGGFKEKRPHGYQKGTITNFDPNQQRLYEQMFAHAGPESYLSRLASGDQSFFEQQEAPALKQFSALQGGLASRFSGQGGGQGPLSSRRSSGFQNTMNQQASDFAQQLQARRQDLQRQAILDLQGLSHELLGQRPSEQYFVPKKQKSEGGWGGALGAAGGAALGFFGSGGNPYLGLKGAQLGYGIGSAF